MIKTENDNIEYLSTEELSEYLRLDSMRYDYVPQSEL
nr:MAG TPA: hypothetical protein [Caudoviricetes sp.]